MRSPTEKRRRTKTDFPVLYLYSRPGVRAERDVFGVNFLAARRKLIKILLEHLLERKRAVNPGKGQAFDFIKSGLIFGFRLPPRKINAARRAVRACAVSRRREIYRKTARVSRESIVRLTNSRLNKRRD